MPAGQVALGKLAQTLAYGAKTLLVRGNFDACLTLAREASQALNIQLLNSVNPFRLEGQKTIVFEALEQLDLEPPDWIALPAGNLGNTSAFGKALRRRASSASSSACRGSPASRRRARIPSPGRSARDSHGPTA